MISRDGRPASAPFAAAPARTRPWPRLARAAAFLAVGLAAAGARILTLPRSPWESDELLFMAGIRAFDPALHHPHPPGFPLFIALGKVFGGLFGDPFRGLLALAVASSALGAPALVAALRRAFHPLGELAAWRLAVTATLLFHLSPGMLVQGALPMSDPPALLFLCLALLCAVRALERPSAASAALLGAAAAGALGCRPQLLLTVGPLLVAFAAAVRKARPLGAMAAAFSACTLAWLVPLVARLGGVAAWWAWESGHAAAIGDTNRALWRSGWSPVQIVARFAGHPWGPSALALPILACAALGAWLCWRRRLRGIAPFAGLAAVHLGVCLALLEPADGVRYALPATLGCAVLATVGLDAIAARTRLPGAGTAAAAAFALGGLLYAWPVLDARLTTPSPPFQAVTWATEHLGRRAQLVVEKELLPHAAILLPDLSRAHLDEGLDRAALHPGQPTFLLGAGESGWPGAVTFRWPDSPAYRRLTRNQYRVVSLSPIPPERRAVRLRGVGPYEPTPSLAAWRWLDPTAALRVYPFGATAVRLRLGLPPTAPWPDNPVTVRAGARGQEVLVPRGGAVDLALAIPPDAASDLTFTAGRSFVPAEHGGGADRRRLAVQLLRLELGDAPPTTR